MMSYEEMLYMPHPVSKKHPQMSRYDRAAQFSPFAALTGHEAAVQEAARITQRKVELDENEKEQLNQTLVMLLEKYQGHPMISITYFCPDAQKDGGEYKTVKGQIRKLDENRKVIYLENHTEISLEQVIRIEEWDREKETDFI